MIYSALFGVGEILLGTVSQGLTLLAVSAVAGGVIARNLTRESATRADRSS